MPDLFQFWWDHLGVPYDDIFFHDVYRDRRQDVAVEMERNLAAPKQSQVRPSSQLLLNFPPFPVRHPGANPGRCWGKKNLLEASEVT